MLLGNIIEVCKIMKTAVEGKYEFAHPLILELGGSFKFKEIHLNRGLFYSLEFSNPRRIAI